MKATPLLPLLLVGAYAATVPSSRAADSIYRSQDFEQTAAEITDCPGHVLIKRHPELTYVSGPTTPGTFISGAWSQSTHDYTWLIIATSTGATSSHIDLHTKSTKPGEIEEVWRVIEECAKQ